MPTLNPGASKGGYSLDAISSSATAVARIILGEAPPELPPMTASEDATETVWQVAMQQSKYWKSVTPKSVEPREGMSVLTPWMFLLIVTLQRWKTSPSQYQVSSNYEPAYIRA